MDVDLAPVLKTVATVIAGRTGFDVSHVERLHLRDRTAGQGHRLRRSPARGALARRHGGASTSTRARAGGRSSPPWARRSSPAPPGAGYVAEPGRRRQARDVGHPRRD
ncbi:MAG: hypothetical protein R3F43_06010 [bacterium]